MRRVALLFGLLVLLTVAWYRYPDGVLAVKYPAGWNLVAGPDGSTLKGAAGSL